MNAQLQGVNPCDRRHSRRVVGTFAYNHPQVVSAMGLRILILIALAWFLTCMNRSQDLQGVFLSSYGRASRMIGISFRLLPYHSRRIDCTTD
jgi:hypothetical protein